MRSTLNITLRIAEDNENPMSGRGAYKKFNVHFEPAKEQRSAIVTLPSYQHFREGTLSLDDLQIGALSVCNSLLEEVSLLPRDRFYEVLKERFAQGLLHKLLIGATYGKCLQTFVGQEEFESSKRAVHPSMPLPKPFISRLPESLAWFDGPGPGYSEEKAREMVGNRYTNFARPIARTLRRLAQEPEFQTTLSRLRESGWKDWHILSAVFHATTNYRLNKSRLMMPRSRQEEAAVQRIIKEAEPENAIPVPLEEYKEENLRAQMPVYMATVLKTNGLEIHQYTLDTSGVEDFITQRYNFWNDDVEHEDPFKS